VPLPDGIRALLLDIEGTTTPISFVYEVLFPFARLRLVEACRTATPGSALAAALDRLRAEYEGERSAGHDELPDFGSGASYAAYLMDRDRKSTGLKELQGLIWDEGYRSGELKGEVFRDVPRAFERWHSEGLDLWIYSSGSIHAQRLLFGNSEHGDLTAYLSGYYDTATGPKRDPASYGAIAADLELSGEQILFLSDVVEELDAAATAGLQTGLLARAGNHPVADNSHRTYSSFDELH
jgi:enolase-phosphatase E1